MTTAPQEPLEATAPPGRPARLVFAALVPVVVGLGALVVLARQGGLRATETIWAEDGTIFFQQASRAPLSQLLGDTYAGYLHVLPRLLTQPSTWLPLDWADSYLAWSAALVTALLALTVFLAARQHICSPVVRGTYAVVLLLVPVGQSEVLANVANLHWWLILAAFWVLLWRPGGRWPVALTTVVVALAVLSDPLTLLLAPVAAARLRWRGPWWHHLPEAALAVGGAVQVFATLTSPDDRTFDLLVNPLRLGGYYAKNVIVGGLWGSRATEDASTTTLAVWALLALVVLVPLAWLIVRARERRVVILWCLVMSVVLYVVPVALTGVAAPRYALVPVTLLYGAVAAALDAALARRAAVVRTHHVVPWVPALLVLVVPIAMLAWNFAASSVRSDGPLWDPGLAQARSACHQGIAAPRTPITPAGWTVSLPCAVLSTR